MGKFEVGKRYYESGVTFEIIGRTAKTVAYRMIQHAGKFNERIMKEGKAKIYDWKTKEVFICGDRTIEA